MTNILSTLSNAIAVISANRLTYSYLSNKTHHYNIVNHDFMTL